MKLYNTVSDIEEEVVALDVPMYMAGVEGKVEENPTGVEGEKKLVCYKKVMTSTNITPYGTTKSTITTWKSPNVPGGDVKTVTDTGNGALVEAILMNFHGEAMG
eukprot:TRINITY_DN935_c1_g1_i1.p1 TRINITY_DN935_c1_g1~~TRINITY_DN935_c1_g1_i1.p1  ORF type:complete len:104 (+),score=37.35 TRINITY_DN935_c1_g1_i1:96-407(+)